MQKIDFYILKDADPLPFLGRLVDKLYKEKHRAYVHCDTQAIAENLDDFLWAFDDASFIPHQILSENMDELPPVILGYDRDAPYPYEILVVFGETFPTHLEIYQRLLYVVATSHKNAARQQYKILKEQGYEVVTHQM